MIGDRTRISLAQYLQRQPGAEVDLLFTKHALEDMWNDEFRDLVSFLRKLDAKLLQNVLGEIVATEAAFRANVVNSYGDGQDVYEARWRDLLQCLLLDGYSVNMGEHRLAAIDPLSQGASHVEDALAAEIGRSGLPSAEGMVNLLEQSAAAFRKVPPDYNGCLSNVRAALQTLATKIALARQQQMGGSFQADKWGQVTGYLHASTLITKQEEDLITSVYTFISPGAHTPIGLSEEELVRLGRGMAVSICYFLVKLHNG